MRKQKDGFFEITCLHRNDIRSAMNLTIEQASKITDEMMEQIAEKMDDSICEQLFWELLPRITEKVTNKDGDLNE